MVISRIYIYFRKYTGLEREESKGKRDEEKENQGERKSAKDARQEKEGTEKLSEDEEMAYAVLLYLTGKLSSRLYRGDTEACREFLVLAM